MNPFEIATLDIFGNADFLDEATVAGATVPVIASEIAEAPALTEFGLDEGVSFFLRVQKASLAEPRKNDLVVFHGVEYRIARATLDSSGLVWRIDLKSKSSR